jgi:ADP-ribose pyrophosphatase
MKNTNYRGRAQALVIRDGKILLAKQHDHWVVPGGRIENGETPDVAALRELSEECNVRGKIVKKTSEWTDPYDQTKVFYTYQIDIGDQTPTLGFDPELETQYLTEIAWLLLDEIPLRDRYFLFAAGLFSIPEFYETSDRDKY